MHSGFKVIFNPRGTGIVVARIAMLFICNSLPGDEIILPQINIPFEFTKMTLNWIIPDAVLLVQCHQCPYANSFGSTMHFLKSGQLPLRNMAS